LVDSASPSRSSEEAGALQDPGRGTDVVGLDLGKQERQPHGEVERAEVVEPR
jgi:hypothetical protein